MASSFLEKLKKGMEVEELESSKTSTPKKKESKQEKKELKKQLKQK